MRLNGLILAVVLLGIKSTFILAQTTGKVWDRLTINVDTGSYVFFLEPQQVVRTTSFFDQFLNGLGVGYHMFDSLTFWLGSTYVITGPINPRLPKVHEMRLWQQAIFNKEFESFYLNFRTRLEERENENFPQWNYRSRNLLVLTKPFYRSLSWVISNEIFINIRKTPWTVNKFIEQNRAFVGISQHASKTAQIGIGYLYQSIYSQPRQIGHVAYLFMQYDFKH